MAAVYTIKVEGLRELIARGDTAVDKDMKKFVREGLRDAVRPVQAEATRLFIPYDRVSAVNYRTVVRKSGVVAVEQRLKKSAATHRRRKNFAGLQMRKALLPGFERTYPAVVQRLQQRVDEIGHAFTDGGRA